MPAIETVANSKVVSALSQILLQLFQEVYEFVLYELVSQKKKNYTRKYMVSAFILRRSPEQIHFEIDIPNQRNLKMEHKQNLCFHVLN